MADEHDREAEAEWGNSVAKITFIATVVSAALFLAAVILFIL